MNFSLGKLSKYGFNRRVLTEQDFYDICQAEGIEVFEMDVPTSFYFSVNGKHFIVIKSKLKGLRKTFSMFHELAHHFLHGGKDAANAFFFGLLHSKNEIEADAVALIALLPKTALKDYQFLEDHPNRFAKKLYKDRQRLWFLYQI